MTTDASLPAADKKSNKISKRGGPRANAGGYREGAGRKKGSLNKSTVEIKTLAKTYSERAIRRAAQLAGLEIDDEGNPIGMATSESAQIAAIGIILDRAHGKPSQVVAGDDENPISHVMQVEWVVKRAN